MHVIIFTNTETDCPFKMAYKVTVPVYDDTKYNLTQYIPIGSIFCSACPNFFDSNIHWKVPGWVLCQFKSQLNHIKVNIEIS